MATPRTIIVPSATLLIILALLAINKVNDALDLGLGEEEHTSASTENGGVIKDYVAPK